MKDGDDPAVVAKVIVAAATDPKPKLRYTAGPRAGRVSTLRRIVPARVFDKQIRKFNRLPAEASTTGASAPRRDRRQPRLPRWPAMRSASCARSAQTGRSAQGSRSAGHHAGDRPRPPAAGSTDRPGRHRPGRRRGHRQGHLHHHQGHEQSRADLSDPKRYMFSPRRPTASGPPRTFSRGEGTHGRSSSRHLALDVRAQLKAIHAWGASSLLICHASCSPRSWSMALARPDDTGAAPVTWRGAYRTAN